MKTYYGIRYNQPREYTVSSVGDRIAGKTISHSLRGELILILLVQGHCVQFGLPMRSHCDFCFSERQVLLLKLSHWDQIDVLSNEPLLDAPDMALFGLYIDIRGHPTESVL